MTNVRTNGINPLKNLTQTAYDLAFYLRYVNPNEIMQTAEEVKGPYTAPHKIRIIGPVIKFMGFRSRSEDIDKTIEAFRSMADSRRSTSEYAKQKPLLELTDRGGWEETSLNTNFLRGLVRKVPGYNPDVVLTKDEILQLRELLSTAFDERVRAEVKLNEQQKKIREIDHARMQKEQELFKKQDELLRKQAEVTEYVSKLADLEKKESTTDARLKEVEKNFEDYTLKVQMIEKEKTVKESELKNLEQEKALKEKELEATRKILTALSPDFDMKGLDKTQMDEAVMIAKVAVRTYKEQLHEQKKMKNELASLDIVSAKRKQQTDAVMQPVVISSHHDSLKKEMDDMIMARKKNESPMIKKEFASHLALLLQMKSENMKVIPTKGPSALVEERKKELLEKGFLSQLKANLVNSIRDDYKSGEKSETFFNSEPSELPPPLPERDEPVSQNNNRMN